MQATRMEKPKPRRRRTDEDHVPTVEPRNASMTERVRHLAELDGVLDETRTDVRSLSARTAVHRARRLIRAAPIPTRAMIAVGVAVLDQATKSLARWLLPLCTEPGCDVTGIWGPLAVVRVENAGSAVGFAQGFDLWTLLAALGLIGAPLLARRSTDRLLLLGAALLAGGGLGNLLDRLLFGAVTDFIDVGAPLVFNVADIALAIGAVLMTWTLNRRTAAGALDPRSDSDRPAEITEGGVPWTGSSASPSSRLLSRCS